MVLQKGAKRKGNRTRIHPVIMCNLSYDFFDRVNNEILFIALQFLQHQLRSFRNFYYLFFPVRIHYLICTNSTNNQDRD